MSERLTNVQVAAFAVEPMTAWCDITHVQSLAREVQESRRLIGDLRMEQECIDALRPTCPTCDGTTATTHTVGDITKVHTCADCADGKMPLDKWVALLVQTLTDAREDVEGWAAYAEPYFIQKHDLAGDLAAIDAVLKMAEVLP